MASSSATGQSLRCTDSDVDARFWNIASATNGHIGASSCVTVIRHSCSTAWASPSFAFQNRERERRTYQLLRSSTRPSTACAARSASNRSSASVASVTVLWSRDRTQRSSTWLGARTGSPGVHPSRFEYVTKKE